MVAKERTPSRMVSIPAPRDRCIKLTDGCDDLRFHSELVLEAAGKVADAALSVAGNVGHLSDVVEHVAAGE